MPMSLRQNQEGTTCRPQMEWIMFPFLRHMESMQLYKLESYVIMHQMMNLMKMAMPRCILNVM